MPQPYTYRPATTRQPVRFLYAGATVTLALTFLVSSLVLGLLLLPLMVSQRPPWAAQRP